MSGSAEKNREALRWLLLPMEVGAEGAAVLAALEKLESLGVRSADVPTWLELELEAWRASSAPSPDLVAVVAAYIGAGEDDLAELLADKYFDLHKRLSSQPLLGHEGASALLSHARLVALLASQESLSAAQIAKLIAVRDTRTPVAWGHIQTILSHLGLRPSLRIFDVEQTYEVDQALELEVFADAEESVCAEMVAMAGERLGFPDDLLGALETLFPAVRAPKGPYLQMLHFQCVLAEFYDHDLSAIYEFTPRGEASEWLFDRYPDSLEVSGNPFLNNAKSVDRLGEEWARSKKPAQKAEAHALVQIINGLDSMGFAARRELASWLRQLLVRRIRLAEGTSISLPSSFTSIQARRLLDAVAAGETRTRGILEQRLLDAACSLRHPAPEWIARGLKDSVNATNISRKKCGDCDFQDPAHQVVVAYEAHAGRLTDLYIRAHLRTLSGVLKQRKREWAENVGPDLKWTVTVVFVSHESDLSGMPIPEEDGNVTIETETMAYRDLLRTLDENDPAVMAALQEFVLEPLSLGRTPDSVRQELLDLISS